MNSSIRKYKAILVWLHSSKENRKVLQILLKASKNICRIKMRQHLEKRLQNKEQEFTIKDI